MDELDWLAERFEVERPHMRAVAYRMLGSLAEAEDAVQESWLRLSRSATSSIENLSGWLTTVIARVCLDHLRARSSRREDSLDTHIADHERGSDPEQEALLAESVGLALLVVLDRLAPAERIAFVLHDLFDVPFEEIAPIVGRSATAARQLASRARRRLRGTSAHPEADLAHNRSVVEAFLAASHAGDFTALLALLDPDVVFRPGHRAASGAPIEIHGAPKVARQIAQGGLRGTGRTQEALPALVDGSVGVIVTRHGRLFLVLKFTITRDHITEIEVVIDPTRLRHLTLAVLDG
ncbi:MAG: sigma-70 family RNA polymerase sigma factor [Ktedonobacterales bacterium]|nr:sigma-70 family RNA polymerase sigma factor [Ktedonobacterales bacterium]